MFKRMILMLLAAGLVFGGVFGYKAFGNHMMQAYMKTLANPPQTVSTAKAESQDWQPQIQSVGSLRAVNGADLSLETAGIVDEIDFKSGDDTAMGAVLLRLRTTDDVAKLQSLQAAADLAQITYNRDQKQFQAKAISQAVIDTDSATLKNDTAQVAEQQAVIDKKVLRAPFAGHLGIRAIDLGQYLSPGTTIVTLQSLDPIFLDFYLPQQDIDKVKTGQKVSVSIDAFPGQTFPGEISAVNPLVASASRNMQVRAVLANPDHKLLPGMYATVGITSGAPEHYITLPQTAITFNSYGNTVFLVEDKSTDDKGKPKLAVRQTFVTTGETRGDQIAILSGISAGDTVVTAGQIKLHNGTPIIVNNTITPADDSHPAPADH